jgi:hypothetical protein
MICPVASQKSHSPAQYQKPSWAMHMHVSHRIGLAVVEAMFREQFGLHVDRVEIHMFKSLLARYHRPTYRQLLGSLRSGNLTHADETEVSLRTGRGYIWVFASLETVSFRPRATRFILRESGSPHETGITLQSHP